MHGRAVERPAAEGRGATVVERRDLEERLPRSAPDALRYEPGVFVQQTGHGQASPFVRGRTGQQVLILFDGIRLNNSTYRQGPNQYFFTVDAWTLRSVEVMRGGASTLYGSDALAGVVDARPLEPTLDLDRESALRPRVMLRATTADEELGFRSQVDAQITRRLRVIAGLGARRTGLLESGGRVCGPDVEVCTEDAIPLVKEVPRFEDDGRTQLGTGFREVTADARIVYTPAPRQRLVSALYVYRQLDSPRTDQCPPPEASVRECLTIDEQFRTLAYVGYRSSGVSPIADKIDAKLSFQRQHERRTRRRPQSFVENGGRDDVNTFGALARAHTEAAKLASWLEASVGYGADGYFDVLDSAAWTRFTDNDIVVTAPRGQYLAGSTYGQGGGYVELETSLQGRAILRTGGRVGLATASSPGEAQSATVAVDRTWPVLAGHAGVELRLVPGVSVMGNLDRSYRTPNLDDLTARQQVGPGIQFENAGLGPESAVTVEGGLRVRFPFLEAEVWGYRSLLYDAIQRAVRDVADCPPETPGCGASRARFQLVNLDDTATIDGLEVYARAFLPAGFVARGTLAYTVGEGPNPQDRPADPSIPYEERVPLSRIPPLNGTVELKWESPFGAYVGAGMRWAATQDRLAISDRSDARVPEGGTPGFVVFDLRAGYRFRRNVRASVVLENVGDAAYRYHGSSINGPGRGLLVNLEAGL